MEMPTASSATLVSLLALAPCLVMGQSVLDPIAEVGKPSGVQGAPFAKISNVYVHPSGRVAVDARIDGTGISAANDAGLWHGTPGTLNLIAREGGVQGFNTMTLAGFAPGGIHFRSTENGTVEGGIYTHTGALANLGNTGLAAPGTAQNFNGFGNFSGNDLGQLSVFARLTGPITQDTSIYSNIGGTFLPVAVEGAAVPGIASHTFLDMSRGGYLVLNDQNYLAGYVGYIGPGRIGVRAGGILLREPAGGTWQAIINKMDPAPVPGGGAGIKFDNFSSVTMNNNGEMLFAAALYQALPVTVNSNAGVWHWNAGVLTPVARENEQADGLPPGVVYDIFEELFLSPDGVRVVVGRVRGAGVTLANDRCIWADTGSGLELVLREGVTQLKGKSGGILLGAVQAAESLSMDLQGNLLLQASVGGSRGVWLRAAASGSPWTSILTEGESVADTNAIVREVYKVRVSKFFPLNLPQGGGPVGRLRSFYEQKVALLIEHSGGEGAYFLKPGAIPLEAVAIGGMEAPGVPGSRWHQILRDQVINSSDIVDFRATMKIGPGGVTTADDLGIWAQHSDATIGLVAREGSQASGAAAGALYKDFPHTPAWNDNKVLAFHGSMQSGPITAATANGLWRGPEGALELVAQSGVTDLPDLPAAVPIATFFGLPVLLQDGTIFVRATLRAGTYPRRVGPGTVTIGSNNDGVLLRFTSGPTVSKVIIREGDPIAGGGTVAAIETDSNLFAANIGPGLVAFRATLTTSGLRGVYLFDGTSITRYAQQGQAVPNAGAPTLLNPGHPIMSDTGMIALKSTLSDNSQTISVGSYTGGIAGATLVAHTGVPQSAGTYGPVGISPDATWSFLSDPGVSNDGSLAFSANLTLGVGGVVATNQFGIWRVKNSSLMLQTRTGTPPFNELGQPGSPPNWNSFVAPRVGSQGRLGFTAGLVDGKIGWWTEDSSNVIRDMVRQNDLLVVPNADTVTRNVIVLLLFYGNSHVVAPTGPSPYRVIGTDKSVIMLGFADAATSAERTSGLFVAEIPL